MTDDLPRIAGIPVQLSTDVRPGMVWVGPMGAEPPADPRAAGYRIVGTTCARWLDTFTTCAGDLQRWHRACVHEHLVVEHLCHRHGLELARARVPGTCGQCAGGERAHTCAIVVVDRNAVGAAERWEAEQP